MSKKSDLGRQSILYQFDPSECPFREFRDNELAPDYWGMGPAAFRATHFVSRTSTKPSADYVWVDEQTQPLPRSARQYLHGWCRAEELAARRWGAEVAVFEENGGGKMSIADTQFSHTQVLQRSSFCRRVLSVCYMLERDLNVTIEHQWENFVFNMPPEGWRARYHIYSPGLKPGGGQQHRPTLSKNGCYLVRLFYLGAWRCVWVSDQVPVDATDSPLLPFSPLLSQTSANLGTKLALNTALLKLAAPDMNSDEDATLEDESMAEFDVLHALTGAVNLTYNFKDPETLWNLITAEVPVFSWDDDDDTLASTVKSKSTKKTTTKETPTARRGSMTSVLLEDTKNLPPYALPGITPGYEMNMLVTVARDLPLKKPLPEPEVPLWKTYRWVDWARRHGLYEAFDCPRTRFLKVNALLKLSYAPHLLDVQSTESVTYKFREEHDRVNPPVKKGAKDLNKFTAVNSTAVQQMKEELREWIRYDAIQKTIKNVSVLYYPSMYKFTSVASNPPSRITKALPNKALDMPAPKSAPLYLQIDGPDENALKISLNTLHPRVLFNCGVPILDYIEPAYLVLEVFEWFADCELPMAKAYIETRGYSSVEIKLPPGRHFCRLWIHSRTNWHGMLLSESALLLGTRDIIQCAAVKECSWASRFLLNLGTTFSNWIRINRSTINITMNDREFFKSYQPDLMWKPQVVGYNKALLHWMFRQALQSLLMKRLSPTEFRAVCAVLRHHFCDPDFGLPPKPLLSKSLKGVMEIDPCDCLMPEMEEVEILEEKNMIGEEKPEPPITSQVCELATEELPCGILKEARYKLIRKHEAATFIQAHWRGTWARKCLANRVLITPEVSKAIMENAFGNLEALSSLMNEFFRMYPGARYAYSVASALSGSYGLQQHHGTSLVTSKCKWVPYFQGVFNCHVPVKVHLDVQCSSQYSVVAVYNNDTGEEVSQSYNAHITFNFHPNDNGYTLIGHGTLNQPLGVNSEAHWQLTVLSSIADAFHVCDNGTDPCKVMPLLSARKLHIDEIFIPNRRNILGGIQISANRHEAVSFRAVATSPELEMEAVLYTSSDGVAEELGRCSGTGELHWPYIRVEPVVLTLSSKEKTRSRSHANLTSALREPALSSARSLKAPKAKQSGAKNKSSTKIKDLKVSEPTVYTIKYALFLT